MQQRQELRIQKATLGHCEEGDPDHLVLVIAVSASGLAAKDSGVKPALNGGSAPPSSAAPATTAHVAFDWNSIKVGSPLLWPV